MKIATPYRTRRAHRHVRGSQTVPRVRFSRRRSHAETDGSEPYRVDCNTALYCKHYTGLLTWRVDSIPQGRNNEARPFMPVLAKITMPSYSQLASLRPRVLGGPMKASILLACLGLGTAALGGCTHTVDCSGGVYRSDCLPGTTMPAAASPATASPAAANPGAAAPATANPGTSWYGDPSQFVDVDDRQCRSYGLKFGTHDYADCRIQLSAQHRGLDPNLRPRTTGPGGR